MTPAPSFETSRRLTLAQVHVFQPALHGGFRIGEGEPVIIGIDHEKDVSLVDELVVNHLEIDHLPRDLRGDIDHLGADAAVAGPGRIHIMPPEERSQDQRDDQDDHSVADPLLLETVKFHRGTFLKDQTDEGQDNHVDGHVKKRAVPDESLEPDAIKIIAKGKEQEMRAATTMYPAKGAI